MELEGMIIRDLGQQEGISKAGNPWKKHEWLLETAGQYPRKVKFSVFGERVNTVTFELGKSYVVSVDAESREYNDRWYTDLTAFNARPAETPVMQTPPQSVNEIPQNPYVKEPESNPFGGMATDFQSDNSEEDLPF